MIRKLWSWLVARWQYNPATGDVDMIGIADFNERHSTEVHGMAGEKPTQLPAEPGRPDQDLPRQRPERPERPDRPDRPDRPEHPDRPGRPDHVPGLHPDQELPEPETPEVEPPTETEPPHPDQTLPTPEPKK